MPHPRNPRGNGPVKPKTGIITRRGLGPAKPQQVIKPKAISKADGQTSVGNPLTQVMKLQVYIRSFISDKEVGGGFFRGDGRNASLDLSPATTSRIIHSYNINLKTSIVSNATTRSDFTRFKVSNYKYETTAIPKGSVKVHKKSVEGVEIIKIESDYEAKDPITPSFVTPSVDVHSSIFITYTKSLRVINIAAFIVGDIYPSTEIFVQDISSKNRVFLGVHMQEGNIHSLYADNRHIIIDTNISIYVDDYGNFIKIRKGAKMYSVKQWNNQFIK